MPNIPLDTIKDLISRRALFVLVDRAGGEVTVTTTEFDEAEGWGIAIKVYAGAVNPRFVFTLVSEERAEELAREGVP